MSSALLPSTERTRAESHGCTVRVPAVRSSRAVGTNRVRPAVDTTVAPSSIEANQLASVCGAQTTTLRRGWPV